MTREWVDDAVPAPRRGPDNRDKRWVMQCDVGLFGDTRCPTTSEPSVVPPPLSDFEAAGWSLAKVHGDVCPFCLAKGIKPSTERYTSATATPATATVPLPADVPVAP